MMEKQNSGWYILLFLLISAAAAFGVYYNALSHDFIWDDPIIVERQATAFLSVKDVFFPPAGIPEFGTHYYRPLVMLSFIIDKAIWGNSPFGFHLTVVLFHVLNTILIFWLARILLRRFQYGDIGAFLSSLVFAVHPIHTESVVWIAGRSDVMAALFFFLSLILYLKFKERSKLKAQFLILSALIFLLACLAKETSLALILLLPIIDITFSYDLISSSDKALYPAKAMRGAIARHERRRKERIEKKKRKIRKTEKKDGRTETRKEKVNAAQKRSLVREAVREIHILNYIPFALVAFVYLVVRHYALYGGGGAAPQTRNIFEMLKNIVHSYGFYFAKLLWPVQLKAFIEDVPSELWATLSGVLILVFLIFAIALLIAKEVRSIYFDMISFAILFFILTLVPSVMVAVLKISETPVAERYLYIPSFSFCFILGYLFLFIPEKIGESKKMAALARIMILLIILVAASQYSVQTVKRNRVWKNDLVFWEDVVKKGTSQGLPHLNLGLAYAQNERLEDAEREYKKSLASKSKDEVRSLTYNSLGALYLSGNDYDQAAECFTKAISLRRRFALPYYNMAVTSWKRYLEAMREEKRHDKELLEKATEYLEQAVRVNPQYSNAHNLYGKVLVRLGRYDEARKHLETVLKYEEEGKTAQSAKKLLDSISKQERK
jgi:tetratricopeptide (TPR) repeat protein